MNCFYKFLSTGIALSVLAGLTVPLTVSAQGGASGMLEEVITTARKRDESLQDTPLAVSAFDESFIDASLVLEIGDLIDWNFGYFEVGTINENQLIGGQFDQNYSVIANSFLVRKSSIQIERVRSI